MEGRRGVCMGEGGKVLVMQVSRRGRRGRLEHPASGENKRDIRQIREREKLAFKFLSSKPASINFERKVGSGL